MFLFSAFAGLPSVADGYCRSIQNSKQFRDEMEGTPGCAHFALQLGSREQFWLRVLYV
jgi:hypothetical protein